MRSDKALLELAGILEATRSGWQSKARQTSSALLGWGINRQSEGSGRGIGGLGGGYRLFWEVGGEEKTKKKNQTWNGERVARFLVV